MPALSALPLHRRQLPSGGCPMAAKQRAQAWASCFNLLSELRGGSGRQRDAAQGGAFGRWLGGVGLPVPRMPGRGLAAPERRPVECSRFVQSEVVQQLSSERGCAAAAAARMCL